MSAEATPPGAVGHGEASDPPAVGERGGGHAGGLGGEAAVTYRGCVYPWHCDHVGHMNVMWYVGKFDEATWNLFARAGITPAYLRANGRGMAAVDQHIEYRRELHAGDVVAIRSQVVAIEGRKIRFRHEMTNEGSGELAAVTTLLGVHMDTQARRSCPFPPEIVARARLLCAGGGEPPAAAG